MFLWASRKQDVTHAKLGCSINLYKKQVYCVATYTIVNFKSVCYPDFCFCKKLDLLHDSQYVSQR